MGEVRQIQMPLPKYHRRCTPDTEDIALLLMERLFERLHQQILSPLQLDAVPPVGCPLEAVPPNIFRNWIKNFNGIIKSKRIILIKILGQISSINFLIRTHYLEIISWILSSQDFIWKYFSKIFENFSMFVWKHTKRNNLKCFN